MSAPGGISGPYSADEHTLLLYHFEDAANDFESAGDPGNPISNFGLKGSALNLTDTGGPDGRDNKGGGGLRTAQTVPQADLQAANGAFTYEALVTLPDITRDRQILSLDSAGAVRGFNFRTTADGTLSFYGGSGNPDVSARIPNSGEHTFTPGEWFDVVVSYDGNAGNAHNTKFC